jgi:hypothetical protein
LELEIKLFVIYLEIGGFMATSYRIYLDHSIQGPYNLDEIMKLDHLSKETLVCEVGDIEWQSLGECRDIQQQLAFQALKWGPVQQTLMNGPGVPPANPGSVRAVSTSGDFVQRRNRQAPSSKAPVSAPKPTPANKGGLSSWVFNILHGSGQK